MLCAVQDAEAAMSAMLDAGQLRASHMRTVTDLLDCFTALLGGNGTIDMAEHGLTSAEECARLSDDPWPMVDACGGGAGGEEGGAEAVMVPVGSGAADAPPCAAVCDTDLPVCACRSPPLRVCVQAWPLMCRCMAWRLQSAAWRSLMSCWSVRPSLAVRRGMPAGACLTSTALPTCSLPQTRRARPGVRARATTLCCLWDDRARSLGLAWWIDQLGLVPLACAACHQSYGQKMWLRC